MEKVEIKFDQNQKDQKVNGILIDKVKKGCSHSIVEKSSETHKEVAGGSED